MAISAMKCALQPAPKQKSPRRPTLSQTTVTLERTGPEILIAEPWGGETDGYALLDSGGGRKLERFGPVTLDRPDTQAMWARSLSDADWARADARFLAGREEEGKGRWEHDQGAPEPWLVSYGGLRATAELTGFRHVGLFPEHRVHWDWLADRVGRVTDAEVLNMFGHTGMASLRAAEAGARVTHVDASRKAITWARENQQVSGLGERPIRWICEDAARFAAREVRRGNRYAGIVLDPPKYGRGAKNEVWRLDEDLPPLLENCAALLADGPAFLVLTAYATHLSAISLARVTEAALAPLGGTMTFGEMTIRETSTGRLLPTSLFVRWERAA